MCASFVCFFFCVVSGGYPRFIAATVMRGVWSRLTLDIAVIDWIVSNHELLRFNTKFCLFPRNKLNCWLLDLLNHEIISIFQMHSAYNTKNKRFRSIAKLRDETCLALRIFFSGQGQWQTLTKCKRPEKVEEMFFFLFEWLRM